MKTARFHFRDVKTAVKKHRMVDPFSVAKYRMSPYVACEHGCTYCDGRAEKYFVEGVFDQDIVVRKNLMSCLCEDLPKLREPGFISIGSGVSDVYQPVEKVEKVMPQVASALEKSRFGATVMTKSSLILRDLELWKRLHGKNGFVLFVSLAMLDDSLRGVFEPGASPVDQRLDIIREFKGAGIPVGILAMPLIPFLTDTPEATEQLFEKLSGMGVDFICSSGLTLRPGKQKNYFFQALKKSFPGLLPMYERLYRENKPSGMPETGYSIDLYARLASLCDRYGIAPMMPHRIFKSRFAIYDEVNLLLAHMVDLYRMRGVDVSPLSQGLANYVKWLDGEKKTFNRKRKIPYRSLERKLLEMTGSGELDSVIGNERLSAFIKKVAMDRPTFDYVSLKF